MRVAWPSGAACSELINWCIQFLKKPSNTLECMNVLILYSNHRHVSATRVAIFGVVRTRIQPQLCVAFNQQVQQYIILVKFSLSKILFVPACSWPLEWPKYVGGYCNKLTLMHSSAFIGIFKQIIYLINARNMEHVELINWSLYGTYSIRPCFLLSYYVFRQCSLPHKILL